MRVKELMIAPVVTISSDATLATAIDLLIEHRLSGLPVVDGLNQLCGILSEGDLLRRMELGTEGKPKSWWSVFMGSTSPAEAYRRANGRHVVDVMSPRPITIDAHASLGEAAELLQKHKIKRLPVTRDDELVGIITRTDFVRALRPFVSPTLMTKTDAEIRRDIRAALFDQRWAASCSIEVSVLAGFVTLEGCVMSDDQRRAAHVAAENSPGVKAVEDRLQILEPVVIPGF